MKKKSIFQIMPVVWILCGCVVVFAVVSYFVQPYLCLAEIVVGAAVVGFALWRFSRLKRDVAGYIRNISSSLDHTQHDAIEHFPLSAAVCSADGEILWYNGSFRDHVLNGTEMYGESSDLITGGHALKELLESSENDIHLNNRRYHVFASTITAKSAGLYILYYIDVTHFKHIEEEYASSRPAVVLVNIDNVEELTQDLRDSERAQIIGSIETLMEDWVSGCHAILKRFNHDWFHVVLEKRHLDKLIENKFMILDQVRSLKAGDRVVGITLSIGVGQGETPKESEELARQAVEMALGRGGDQAAVKTKNGFDFYGGVSKGVEKRTKVRTRVVASALSELIHAASDVLVMGHRFSDLDCLGSAAALAAIARGYGKSAYVVCNAQKTMASQLIDRYEELGQSDVFITPEEALDRISETTLLIVTDTHTRDMVESAEVLEQAKSIAVIDHHRKMVNYIDNALLFYHEPYSSSASELVTELLQYMGENHLTKLDAEALLAGIMLDTRSFVMKSGVRTFEAAAYLRKLGADTVEVKRLFTGSMDIYKKKSDIISQAQIYNNTAISCDESGDPDIRVAAAQAADELLAISGIHASFALFKQGDAINVSARSFGEFNVQLVMEAIGGGGHITMAGAQLKGATMAQAKERLIEAIDRYKEERERAMAAAQANMKQ